MDIGSLPIGAKVREKKSGIVFLVAAHNHPGYSGSTLVTDRIVCRGCFDAAEEGADHRWIKELGRGDYTLSNVHQWLNSNEAGWFKKQHDTDTPPTPERTKTNVGYADEPGFLVRFSDSFKAALIESDIPCVSGCGDEQRPATVKARVYLLSADELGLNKFTGIDEGSQMPLFRDFRMRIGIKPSTPEDFNFPAPHSLIESNREMGWYYWLRTPHHKIPYIAALVHMSGYISYMRAYNSDLGIRPAVQVSGTMPVSEKPDGSMVYDILTEEV